jgi:hypothetical protein
MSLADTRDPNSLSTRLRRRRDVRLRALIEEISAVSGKIDIIDLGGTVEYWQRLGVDFLRAQKARVTIVNVEASELSEIADADIFRSEVGDACALTGYADNQFDLAHSNSVIEHVRTWQNMKAFAAEMRRVAPNYYVQTPYYWFPFDPHFYKVPFFHWLPRPIRARLLNRFPIAYSGRMEGIDRAYDVVESALLLDGRQFRFLFPDGATSFERFGGLRKSMVATRTRGVSLG